MQISGVWGSYQKDFVKQTRGHWGGYSKAQNWKKGNVPKKIWEAMWKKLQTHT